MNVEDLGAIRRGADYQQMKPQLDNEIETMQKAVVSFVLAAVNNGSLTPEIALTKWVEYISYQKLQQKIDQRIRIGQSIGAANKETLDLTNKIR